MQSDQEYSEYYQKLQRLIITRKENESRNPNLIPKTTVNYCDEKGHSLLHYAILSGDINRVVSLIEREGADINQETQVLSGMEKPIELALKSGHLEIAQYLYEKGADCFEVKLATVQSLECRVWFSEMIKRALNESYPIENKDDERRLAFVKKNQFFNESSIQEFKPQERASEIGNQDYLVADYENLPIQAEKIAAESPKLLNLAAANGQIEVLNFLYKSGVPINPDKTYTQSAFQEAMRCHQFEMAKHLLDLGADINWQNQKKETALMQAVDRKDKEAIFFLLSHNASLLLQNMEQNTVFHKAAAKKEDATIWAIFQQEFEKLTSIEKEEIFSLRNIYGKTTFDLIANPSDTAINQLLIGRKIFYYVRSQYQDTSFLDLKGWCSGFTYLFLFYSAREEQEFFFNALERIVKWDGTQEALTKEMINFFEEWTSHITFFQFSMLLNIIPFKHHQRVEQHLMVGSAAPQASPHF